MSILDRFGNPITPAKLTEPQTANIVNLTHQWRDINTAKGLSPARLSALFSAASQGDLMQQAQLFDDMLELDAHLFAEMEKRKSAPLKLDWTIAPPRNASAAEKKLAAYADEILRDMTEFDDLIKAMMDAVGHGFSALEITWYRDGNEWLPKVDYRPQTWFQLPLDRSEIRLRDGSTEGVALQPFGWILHTAGLTKTGYLGRMPLYRVLAWPFLYKLYGINDFAEFLETYGLPIIIGKYNQGASPKQQGDLLRAVRALGHDARAIMPAEMQMEIQKITASGNAEHMTMVDWADKSQSKCILGATLTSQADGKTSTNALGTIHNDVRNDIRDADCQQLAATISRDLIYPLLMLNQAGLEGFRRCPRLLFDTSEAEDLALYADGLPKLVSIGMKIPARYAYEKLKIPQPEGTEEVLGTPAANPVQTAAATITGSHLRTASPEFTPQQQQVETLTDDLLAQLGSPVNVELIHAAIKAAKNPDDLEDRLAALMVGVEHQIFSQTLEQALFAADVLGYVHAGS